MKLNAKRIFTIICAFCFWVVACIGSNSPNILQKGITNADLEMVNKTPTEIRAPRGDEINIKVEVLPRRTVRLTVSNMSSDTVFLPFMCCFKDKYAFAAVYSVEIKDKSSGDFKPLEWKSDFSPGIHPLEPGDFYKIKTTLPKKGTYKIIIYYTIDRNIAEETRARARMGAEEWTQSEKEFDEKQTRSRGTAISNTFVLN